jgi:hypothetical protein
MPRGFPLQTREEMEAGLDAERERGWPIMRVVSIKQSPLNALRWCCQLTCGHDGWVTAKSRPTRKFLKCSQCEANAAMNAADGEL